MSLVSKRTFAICALMAGATGFGNHAVAHDWQDWKCEDGTTLTFDRDPANITYNGTGCPVGTLDGAIDVTEDGSQFTVIFGGDYIAERGPGFDPRLSTKTCIIRVPVKIPAGKQISVTKVDLAGFAEIAPWATGYHRSKVFFPLVGGGDQDVVRKVVEGREHGKAESYLLKAEVDTSTRSKCGGDSFLGLDTRVYITGTRRDYSSISVDSADGGIFSYRCHTYTCDDWSHGEKK